MSRGLGRVQRRLLDGLIALDRRWGRKPWALHTLLWEAYPRPSAPPPVAAKPHKLRRRPAEVGDRDNPSRAMAGLCARGLVQREPDGQFGLTVAGAALSMPATVWAVRVTRSGLEWREVKLIRATATRATLLLDGLTVVVSLTKLFGTGARSAGWTFTDQRHGLVEMIMELMQSFDRKGGMTGYQAAAILGLPSDRLHHHPDAIQAAFRREVKVTHPDAGGSAEAFGAVTMARDALLSILDDD
jgi:hypothetical protein